MSIKDYILSKTLAEEGEPQDATEHLLSSPKNAKRLMASVNTPASEHRVFESLEELRDALEI